MITNEKYNSSAQFLAQLTSLVSGFQKHFGSEVSMKLGNTTYAPADIITALKGMVTLQANAKSQRAQWQTTLQALRDAGVQTRPLARLLTQYLRAVYGDNASILADFGLAPAKARVRNPEVLVQAAQKAKATRAVRHTMGSQQKKLIKAPALIASKPLPSTG